MSRLLREPLVHFLILGASMFAIYAFRSRNAEAPKQSQIVVSAGRIEQLQLIFRKTWQRAPTADELKNLIDEFILEEAYYRKAVEMGIDRDDTIIRRRLRQKLEFLTDDASALISASDETLEAYLSDHADRFREPPTYTFRQVYFSPDKHSKEDAQWFSTQIELLKSGSEEVGDPTLIAESFVDTPSPRVDSVFGIGFAALLDKLVESQWTGPVESGLGLHLIRVDGRVESRLPTLEEIRPIVKREWSNEQRVENRKAMNAELLRGYEVIIEWPKPEAESLPPTAPFDRADR